MRSVPLPVVFLLCVGVWFVTWTCGSAPRGDDGAPRISPPRAQTVAPQPPERARAPVREQPVVEAMPDAPAAPAQTGDPGPPLDPGWFPLDVEVVDHEGAPVERAEVYALPAGSSGTGDEDAVPRTSTAADGRARLLLPTAGPWDVGANWGLFHAMSTDARTDAGVKIRLTFDAGAEIQFTFEGEVARTGDRQSSYVDVSPVEVDGECNYAGRHDPPHLYDRWEASEQRRTGSLRAPLGVPLVASVYEPPYRVSPERFTAPARVDLTGGVAYVIDPRLRLEPADGTHPTAVLVRPRFVWGDSPSAPVSGAWCEIDAGERFGNGDFSAPDVFVDASEGTVHWSGDGVVPGEAQWRAETGKRTPLTLTIRLQDPLPAAEEEPAAEGRVAVRPRIEGPRPKAFVWCEVHEGDLDRSMVEDGLAETLPVLSLHAGATLFGATGMQVTPAVRIGERAEQDVTLTFGLGGFVVVVPDGIVPYGAGSVRLRRRDGLAMPFRSSDDDFRVAEHAPVRAGAIIGPFPAGALVLDVLSGSTVIGEARTTVLPGRYVQMEVPVAPRRAR